MNEKQQIEYDLAQLNKISFSKPTARQLHQSKNAMVNRVQRMENKRYQKQIQLKRLDLLNQLGKQNKRLLQQNKKETINSKKPSKKFEPQKTKLPKRVLTRIESKKRLKGGRR